jgi:OmpA-OmpF porin, OOP family
MNPTTRSAALLLSLSLPIGTMSGALAASDAGPYVAFGAGTAGYHADYSDQVHSAYAGSAFTVTSAGLDDKRDTAWRVAGGYRFNDYAALELAYVDLGQATAHYALHAGNNSYRREGKYEADGWNASVLGRWSVAERVALFGKVGVFFSRLRYSETGSDAATGTPYSFSGPSQRDTNASFGLGAEFAIDDRWMLRADWDRYRNLGRRFNLTVDENGRFDHVDLFSVSAAYRF